MHVDALMWSGDVAGTDAGPAFNPIRRKSKACLDLGGLDDPLRQARAD
jgi:hypothetical protein